MPRPRSCRRRGADLALYNFDGPQGYRGLRDFVVDKVSRRPAIKCSADDVLITSGSGQGIDLVNQLFLERGDTVILEEFTYGGALTKLKRLGVNVVGAPLDDEGLRIDALARIIEDLGRKDASFRNTSTRSRRSRTRPARSCRCSAARSCSR